MSFLTAEEFAEHKAQHYSIIPWREVHEGIIYRIEKVEEIQTRKGQATVVELVDTEGGKFKAFATTIIARGLRDFNWGGSYFIKSLGKKQSTANPDRSYYEYKLVKQD